MGKKIFGCTICIFIVVIISVCAGYYVCWNVRSNEFDKLRTEAANVKSTIDDLERVNNELRAQVARAQEASSNANTELAEYRRSVEERERNRQAEIERIINETVSIGIGANKIAEGIDGDIELVRQIRDISEGLIESIRDIQK